MTTLAPAGRYDAARADRAVNFVRLLKHTKGQWAGVPFQMQDWQESIFRRMFGTVRPDGSRQYRTAYLEVPRKNGKSESAAAVALYLLYADGEMGGEIYSAAADKDQASLVFNVAAQMVRQSPALMARSKIIDSQRRIVDTKTGSVYRAISSEAYSKHGLNASGIIFDEVHALPDRELWDVLATSTGARRQPLTFAITTAGYDRGSICYELHTHALRCLEAPEYDPSFLPVIYAAPEESDWQDEAVWAACNPGLGVFRSLDEMRQMAARAREAPGLQNTFRRLYLCQWTENEERLIDPEVWRENESSVDTDALEGRVCFAGLDLASVSDVAALCLLFPPQEDGERWQAVMRYWVPEEGVAKRSTRDRVPYDAWVRDGWMRATAGNIIDYDVIREDIRALAERYDIREVAYDRWGATQLVTQLTGDGATVVPMGQGMASMAAPTKEFLKIVLSRRLATGGDPVLRWMAANVQAAQDAAGNLKPDKARSREKIDGIVALIMALDRATRHMDTPSTGPGIWI